MTRTEKFKELRDSLKAINEQHRLDETTVTASSDVAIRLADDQELKRISKLPFKKLSEALRRD